MGSIVYLHGFRSSGNCRKSQILADYLSSNSNLSFISPDIADEPGKSYQSIKKSLQGRNDITGIVGSSLGGFWARVLSRELNVPAVLLNPVVDVQKLLLTMAGSYTNPYTGFKFVIHPEDGAALAHLEKPADELDSNLLHIYLGAQDNILDYHRTEDWFNGCFIRVIPDGDHYLLDSFLDLCPEIINFFEEWNCKSKAGEN